MAKFDLVHMNTLLSEQIGDLTSDPEVSSCLSFCFNAHEGQYRESPSKSKSVVPYIVHPVGVAILAHRYFSDFVVDLSLIHI